MALATSSIPSQQLYLLACIRESGLIGNTSSTIRLPAFPVLKRACKGTVVVHASTDGRNGLSSVIDKMTMKEVSKEDVLKNQEQNESEKRSVFGAVPSTDSSRN